MGKRQRKRDRQPKAPAAPAVPEGGHVDLPWESGTPDPQPLTYRDLGEGKRYKEGGFRERQKATGKGSGERPAEPEGGEGG